MTLSCPCCRAATAGPACRRCKADLSLLVAVAARRRFLVDRAKALAAAGEVAAALRALDGAAGLRAGDDVRRLRAAALLLAGRFADAAAAYDDLGRRQ